MCVAMLTQCFQVRRTGLLSAPEPYAADLQDEDELPIQTQVLVFDAPDLQLLCDFRTLGKVRRLAFDICCC